MRKMLGWVLPVALMMSLSSWTMAQDDPPLAGSEWLAQLTGNWEFEGEATIAPDQPAIKSKGAEAARMIGNFWLLSESRTDFMGMKIHSLLTLGYDEEKKHYVGTWIDSANNFLWHYTGKLDDSGKILTLEAEGPDHRTPGKMAKFQDIIEIKSETEKLMTSKMQDENGEWVTFATVQYRRKILKLLE